jgi:hypothetical protein
MGEAAVVNLAFVVTFGIILWYAAGLHLRHRRLTRELDQNRD